MPMRGELSARSRTKAKTWAKTWETTDRQSIWRRVIEQLQNPDLQLVLIFSLIGLLACLLLMLLPFSADIAAGVAQLS